jgi:hypothetical protein
MGDANGKLSFGDEDPPAEPDNEAEKKSASTVLVEIAQGIYDFHVSDSGETFAVPKQGPRIVHPVRGGKLSLRKQLARIYFTKTRKAPPQQALADALLVIEGFAQEAGESDLALRVARVDGALWVDLGDATGRAIRITAAGWSIETTVPVLFKRTELTGALPEPERGGDISELWEWLNVEIDDRPLLVACLLASLFPDIPHPVLTFGGEQGTGKTTASKVVIGIVDPSPVLVRKPPKDPESWVTAASGSWIVGLENISTISPWLSDSICRAVTGDGDVRRRLYTDGELAVFSFRRFVVLNGIDLGAIRGDLADRMLPIGLHLIPDEQRLEEDELWPMWKKAHPRLLGALLDLAASLIGVLPSVRLERKPRMADFARILAATDMLLGTGGYERYAGKQASMAAEALTDDEFVMAMAAAITGTFTGTSAELLEQVTPVDDRWKRPKEWPATARQVTQRLRRQAPVLRKAGWSVTDDGGANKRNAAEWTITPPSQDDTQEVGRKRGSRDSRDSPNGDFGESASQASHKSGQSQVDDECPACARWGIACYDHAGESA